MTNERSTLQNAVDDLDTAVERECWEDVRIIMAYMREALARPVEPTANPSALKCPTCKRPMEEVQLSEMREYFAEPTAERLAPDGSPWTPETLNYVSRHNDELVVQLSQGGAAERLPQGLPAAEVIARLRHMAAILERDVRDRAPPSENRQAETTVAINVGDIVVERDGVGSGYLCCGSGSYPCAIVVSVYPFVMVSEEGDMMWSCSKPEYFKVFCRATPDQSRAAFDRFLRRGQWAPTPVNR